jgi:hypothetical protein
MKDQHNTRQFTRRLTLPSGRLVDVVYFESAHGNDDDDQELHRCGACQGELVQPVEWSPLGKSYWQVTLHCPNCDWSGTGVFPQSVVERFDRELDRGTDLLLAEINRIDLENLAEDVDRFARALADGHVLPCDF